jgi:hypothetical protein
VFVKTFINYFRDLFFHDFDAFVLRKISNIKGELVASNANSEMYFKYNELANHEYITVSFTGNYQIESNRRCSLRFIGKNDDLVVISDTDYIQGVYGKKSKIGVTKFDFNLDDHIINFINSNTINEINMLFENGLTNHTKLEIVYNEVNQPAIIRELGSID